MLNQQQILTAAELIGALNKYDREYLALKAAKQVQAHASGGAHNDTLSQFAVRLDSDADGEGKVILRFLLNRKRRYREDVARKLRQLGVPVADLEA